MESGAVWTEAGCRGPSRICGSPTTHLSLPVVPLRWQVAVCWSRLIPRYPRLLMRPQLSAIALPGYSFAPAA